MIDYQFNITEKISNSGIRNLHVAVVMAPAVWPRLRHPQGLAELHGIVNKALSRIAPEERRIAQKMVRSPTKEGVLQADHLDDALCRRAGAVHWSLPLRSTGTSR
ncbi:MAG: hypothetical protein V8Q84_01180 [Bilophila sp.]